jgi:hypothetical protein
MEMKILTALLFVVAMMTTAYAGQPHPQAFKFLQNMAAEPITNAHPYYDCSTGKCERGMQWETRSGYIQVIHELDGQPAQAARYVEASHWGLHVINFNLLTGRIEEQMSDGRIVPQEMTWPDAYNWP